ncbi:MAG: hypothetical protein KDA89_18965, partial [Planctomycetaceae bacterium]|nr:hypothetical protein [Planctomycetaceae bacterium]
ASTGNATEVDQTVITLTATSTRAVVGDQTVTVTISGTGITASDYTLSTTTITILDGQTSGTVTVTINTDTLIEGPETLVATLTSPSAGIVLVAPESVNIVIRDDSAVSIDTVDRFPGTQPTITWQPVTGAVRYEVWFSRIAPAEARVYSFTNLTTTSWTVPEALPPALYRFWMRGFDAAGTAGEWSAPQSFEVQPQLISPLTSTFEVRPTFSWEPVPFATAYEIWIRVSSGDIRQSGITGTTYTPTQDLPSGQVLWWVRATDHTKNYGWSHVGITGNDKRPVVTGPSAPTTNTTPTITWQGVIGAGRYILHVINTATDEVVIREDFVTTTSYTPTTALPVGQYRAWVKSIDAATNLFTSGAWSRPFDFEIIADAQQSDSSQPVTQNLLAGISVDATPVSADESAAETTAQQSADLRHVDSHFEVIADRRPTPQTTPTAVTPPRPTESILDDNLAVIDDDLALIDAVMTQSLDLPLPDTKRLL